METREKPKDGAEMRDGARDAMSTGDGSSPLVRALSAIDAARDAVSEALDAEAGVSATRSTAGTPPSLPDTPPVAKHMDVSIGMLQSEVSTEEAEGMFSYMMASEGTRWSEFSADDFGELAVCSLAHACRQAVSSKRSAHSTLYRSGA